MTGRQRQFLTWDYPDHIPSKLLKAVFHKIYFSSTFFAQTVSNIHVKYLNFGQKLLIRTPHHTLLENIHAEVTKNPYYVLSTKGSQKKVSIYGLSYFV